VLEACLLQTECLPAATGAVLKRCEPGYASSPLPVIISLEHPTLLLFQPPNTLLNGTLHSVLTLRTPFSTKASVHPPARLRCVALPPPP
jgi:hypothetical protein